MPLHEKIRQVLKRRNLSQRETARRLGDVGPSKVSAWCRGENEPSASELERLAVICEVPVGYFFGEKQITDQEWTVIEAFRVSGLSWKEATSAMIAEGVSSRLRKRPSE